MRNKPRLFKGQSQNLDERYFTEIRPLLYERHGHHAQSGVRTGRTLAEHLDSACQFVLTITKIAKVSDDKRAIILASTIIHDLNKLDESGRKVKELARNKEFVKEQLELAGVATFVNHEADYELVRKLIERHSGHNVSDGTRFLPEDPSIEQYAAMLTGADLFDLGISETERFAKVQKELTVAFNRSSNLFRVRLSEDKGYLSSLLLSACEDVLIKQNLTPLAIFPDGELFEGSTLPTQDLTQEIARVWQRKINQVFGGNIEQLVKATTSGIKVDNNAINQDLEETLIQVQALLEKKKASYNPNKVAQDISKHGGKGGEAILKLAEELGLIPVSNAEEFAISEGLKAVYVSYSKTGLKTQDIWDKISQNLGLSPEEKTVIDAFDPLYGRCLFAVKKVNNGISQVMEMLRDSFELRTTEKSEESEESDNLTVPSEMILAVSRMLNLSQQSKWQGVNELEAYVNANPRQRSSFGITIEPIEELISSKMPPETKVQSFSNRLPGGMVSEPKRRGDFITSLAYQLMSIGANFPKASKQEPLYLHFALPQGSSPELLKIWRDFLRDTSATNAEGGTVTVDELKFYRDHILEFKPNKVVGFAFPKRSNFIHSTVVIPVLWGEANNSVALLKSLHLALEMSLAFDVGFPFVLSSNLEVESWTEFYGRVEGIPSTLQPLLDNGKYTRQEAEIILSRLRCLAKLAVTVANLQHKDDCLYDLAKTAKRPLNYYYVLLRWLLREQDDPNFESFWGKIKQPLNQLLSSLMSEDTKLTEYLKQSALIAEKAILRGSSFKRTSQSEPFTAFLNAVRSRKSHLSWDVIFASLIQEYHERLDRIRERGVGATKYEQITEYYGVLRILFENVYQSRPEKLLADRKTLESAYLFFLQEARQELKKEKNEDNSEDNSNEKTSN